MLGSAVSTLTNTDLIAISAATSPAAQPLPLPCGTVPATRRKSAHQRSLDPAAAAARVALNKAVHRAFRSGSSIFSGQSARSLSSSELRPLVISEAQVPRTFGRWRATRLPARLREWWVTCSP